MKLQATDKDDNLFDFNKFHIFKESNVKVRTNIQKRLGKDGGLVTGDRRVDPRTIRVTRDFASGCEGSESRDSQYRAVLNDIYQFFRADRSPHYLEDTDELLRAEIALQEIGNDYKSKGLERRIGTLSLSFRMPCSAWEDLNEIEVVNATGSPLASDDTINLNVSSIMEVYPVISITTDAPTPDFVLSNESNGGAISIGTNGFIPGTTLTMDSIKGRIELDDGVSVSEISHALADGYGFLFLMPGQNVIKYNSAFGNINISIKYRGRYTY
jgi:hypothetical protein